MDFSEASKSTQSVHAGTIKDPINSGVNSPVYVSTAHGYLNTEARLYPRYFNVPNQEAIVKKLCALEHTEDGMIFSSGMAAISAILLALLKPGDHAVFQNDIYGGTHHFITDVFTRFQIEFTFIDACNPKEVSAAIRKNTKLFYFETPSNPLLRIVDLEAVSRIAKSANAISVIDNTFASPVNQNPADFGVDVIVHSGTKYLGGHSDLSCGAVLSRKELIQQIRNNAVNFGGNMNGLDCYLLERSLKTLDLRVQKQNQNALAIARYLEKHKAVKKVYYPGIESHEFYTIAKKQMHGPGGMISFELTSGTTNDSEQFMRKLKLIVPALSLGGIESTVCSPAQTSHSKMSKEERIKAGITDSLIRLSVGIENDTDLIRDIEQALNK